MKYRLFCLLIIGFLLFTFDGLGQNTWMKTFGGSDYDRGYSVTKCVDGGIVVTGLTKSNDGDFSGMNYGKGDIFIIKLNSNGDLDWKRTFGGSNEDGGYSILSLDDGYIILGWTTSKDSICTGMYKGEDDVIVIRVDKEGYLIWCKVYGGSGYEYGTSISTTSDGGFVITGGTTSRDGDFVNSFWKDYGHNIFVMKINMYGDVIWNNVFGDGFFERGLKINRTEEGNFIVLAEYSNTVGIGRGEYGKDENYSLYKLNSNGTILFNTIYGGDFEKGISINSKLDNEYLYTGYKTNINGQGIGNTDILITCIE